LGGFFGQGKQFNVTSANTTWLTQVDLFNGCKMVVCLLFVLDLVMHCLPWKCHEPLQCCRLNKWWS